MLAALLETHGHTVCIAHDARARSTRRERRCPTVALLDIGAARHRRLRTGPAPAQHDASTGLRLVAVTGWGQDHDRARARDAGFDAHLTKPAEADAVLGVL